MEQRFSSENESQPGSTDPGDSLDKVGQRKRLFTILAAVGGAALVLGIAGLASTITSPFPRVTTPSSDEAAQSLEVLKQQDTDGDGLKDYDEAFTHRTSAFVRDSDSDGLSDGDEIAAGTDPNCRQGTTCGAVAVTNINGTVVTSDPTAAALRRALKQAGAPANVIDQTDDATLLQQYRETLLGSSNTNASIGLDDLNSLSGSQIRSLLKANGVADDATLSQFDDETLIALYQEALTAAQ
ncbi:MAG: hypothetical protein HY421_01190 [Candidatus Kerfeldbacteria bacterium]|nr:hypothetical protein [Candidatus Kerfeldbacteria bacterium]